MQSNPKSRFERRMVETAKENLEAMPPPPVETEMLSMREAIKALTPTIAKLLRKGHSRDAVIALLKEQGIECSRSNFRSLYRAPKPRARDAKASAGAKAATTPTSGKGVPVAPPASPAPAIGKAIPTANGAPARGDGRGGVPATPQATAKAS